MGMYERLFRADKQHSRTGTDKPDFYGTAEELDAFFDRFLVQSAQLKREIAQLRAEIQHPRLS